MRTLAFDGRMGASGDMVLGALLAAGADPSVLAPVERALGVDYAVEDTVTNGIAATRVRVLRPAETDSDPDAADHAHDGGHDHPHPDGDHRHAEGTGPARTYADVVRVVESMDLDPAVESDARAVFRLLGEAEASVHGTDLDATHFHEVGADDAIADVVGAALLVADLDPDAVVTTPLAAGGGRVEMSHGVYPVPAPAVVEIAAGADWSLYGGPVEAELLTPTGAAVLAHFADGVETVPTLDVGAVGYGAGARDFSAHPNALRVLVGDSDAGGRSSDDATDCGLRREEITVLETNVDDAAPELLGGLQETLSAVGARDVSVVPLTMKKSRPGHLVRVVADPARAADVARRLVEETGTLGVREAGAGRRWVARRESVTVTIAVDGDDHAVDVKVATDERGETLDVSAEYDDAKAVADRTGIAVREAVRRAERAFRERWRQGPDERE